jgi:hypothetical protein
MHPYIRHKEHIAPVGDALVAAMVVGVHLIGDQAR